MKYIMFYIPLKVIDCEMHVGSIHSALYTVVVIATIKHGNMNSLVVYHIRSKCSMCVIMIPDNSPIHTIYVLYVDIELLYYG